MGVMTRVLQCPSAVKRDAAIDLWMHEHSGELGSIARRWFEVMRACGDDVRDAIARWTSKRMRR